MALTDNIIAYWTMDEAGGTRADSTGNGWTLADPATTGSTTGKLGNALDLDGSSKYMTASSNIDDGLTNAFTIAGWIYQTSSGHVCEIVRNDGGGGATGLLFRCRGPLFSNVLSLVLPGVTGTPSSELKGGTGVTLNTWHHIAVTYDGANCKLYLDGSQDATAATTGNVTLSGTAFYVGSAEGSSEFFQGRIDELGFWSRGLSAAEITTLYNGGTGLTYPFSTLIPWFETSDLAYSN